MNEETRKAVANIRNQPGVFVLTIVNADNNEIPVEYQEGLEEAKRSIRRLLRDQRSPKILAKRNKRVRARNWRGNVSVSRAI